MKFAITALALLLAVPVRADDRVVVASLSPVLSDIAANVGGDRVRVESIVQPGIDPHAFEPTPGDIQKISRARLVLVSGLGFEGYLDKLRTAVGRGPTFVVVGDAMKPLMVEDDHHGHDHAGDRHGKVPDPHWWHSIGNAKIAARVIRDALEAADPAGRATYEANTKQLLARYDELARWAKLQVARIPANRRVLVTSHDALGYLAHDYRFVIIPIAGLSTAGDPSSRHIRDVIAAMKNHHVTAVFAENIENPKVLAEITRETGARIGGEIFADGLGDGKASTYEGMMRHNISTIVDGLVTTP